MYIPDSLFLVNSLICLNCRQLVSSADNLLDPDQTQRTWSGSKLLDTLLILLRKIEKQKQKNDFEKKKSADDKTMANYLVGKKSRWIEMEGATCTCRLHASALYLPAFNTARSRTHIDFYNCVCACVCVCVKVMTSQVCGIDFRWISGYIVVSKMYSNEAILFFL